ncbi:hypothetical protein FHU10_2939 [Serratia fonticola]|jgi:hypothetical protein|uniref:Uncharacterized protein n=1 Tax=Serratia fonticola TaxID=47917 RepID=A0A559T6Y4_SERFO|nr:hypothetical protein [Serratia fonticola]TQI82104.1 hypothetical protein FHU09_4771 [Serratia fonticola]TQI95874.1 hypothetical protein FHU11_1277 [Serratia fonticola]TVZ70371.1 hypothetical protein FHU10_2939 [Serratia fonticola]
MLQYYSYVEKSVVFLWYLFAIIEVVQVVGYSMEPKLFLFKLLAMILALLGSVELAKKLRQFMDYLRRQYIANHRPKRKS